MLDLELHSRGLGVVDPGLGLAYSWAGRFANLDIGFWMLDLCIPAWARELAFRLASLEPARGQSSWIVLYCTVLYCILYRIRLHCTVLCCRFFAGGIPVAALHFYVHLDGLSFVCAPRSSSLRRQPSVIISV